MKKSDLTELAKIHSSAYNSLKIGEKWTPKKARVLLEHFYNRQKDLSFTALVDKKIVGGFTSPIKPWWDGNHLYDGEIFVDVKYQGLGIGTRLIETLFKKALKKYKVTEFEAITHTKTNFPLAWYESMGIKEVKGLVFIAGDIKKVLKKIKN